MNNTHEPYDYQTISEARADIAKIVTDTETKEGQREADHLLLEAKIRERDEEPRDYFREFCEVSDDICNRLADDLAAIDAKNGLEPKDYSALRRPTADVQREKEAVARHNAYSHIRPDADACEICGRKAFATPVDGFAVRECTRCERLICEECSDADADCDQDGYFLTSWVCNGEARSECERLEAEREAA